MPDGCPSDLARAIRDESDSAVLAESLARQRDAEASASEQRLLSLVAARHAQLDQQQRIAVARAQLQERAGQRLVPLTARQLPGGGALDLHAAAPRRFTSALACDNHLVA